ncbi:MAG: c-type cytochrome [Xenococcus sp. MO_188.B8]|nr:c-type cytochrome [Xenococcus sp. MO_188.B8]
MFKKILAMAFAIITVATLGFAHPALADGAGTFSANCAACHAGGGNVINPTATLSQADLEKNGKHSIEAIVTQVTYGKAPMPAFGGKLTDDQIQEVAEYVLSQADAGW